MIQNPIYIYSALAIVGLISVLIDILGHGKTLSNKQAIGWSAFWVSVGLGFGGLVYLLEGGVAASEYYAGYVMEKVLSVDNLMVFVAVFAFFNIKDASTMHKILTAGIVGALIFRGIFVGAGNYLFHLHWSVQVFFGLLVLWAAKKTFSGGDDDPDFSKAWYVRLIKQVIPVTDDASSGKFFTRVGGVLHATPLLLCVFVIELVDIIFAFDSVPAIIAVSKETAIIYSAIIMAVLGLRALFFLMKGAVDTFHLLDKAVGIVLVFIAGKLIVGAAGIHMDPQLSLWLILGTLSVGVIASLLVKKPE